MIRELVLLRRISLGDFCLYGQENFGYKFDKFADWRYKSPWILINTMLSEYIEKSELDALNIQEYRDNGSEQRQEIRGLLGSLKEELEASEGLLERNVVVDKYHSKFIELHLRESITYTIVGEDMERFNDDFVRLEALFWNIVWETNNGMKDVVNLAREDESIINIVAEGKSRIERAVSERNCMIVANQVLMQVRAIYNAIDFADAGTMCKLENLLARYVSDRSLELKLN